MIDGSFDELWGEGLANGASLVYGFDGIRSATCAV
jgi:hypothetical protein